MKKALVDVNVVLDVLLDQQPHAKASGAVWAAIESGSSQGLLAAHAVTTIHYLIRRELGAAKATLAVSRILKVFGVATVDAAVIQEALVLSLAAFEDSVTAAAAPRGQVRMKEVLLDNCVHPSVNAARGSACATNARPALLRYRPSAENARLRGWGPASAPCG
jgi:predicted nucleic acid-binding protein